MRALGIPAIVLICLFLGELLGICLRRWLPEEHLAGESTDVIKLATGLMATLAAMVLSLLISSANNAHNVVANEYEHGLVNILLLDNGVHDSTGAQATASRFSVTATVSGAAGPSSTALRRVHAVYTSPTRLKR